MGVLDSVDHWLKPTVSVFVYASVDAVGNTINGAVDCFEIVWKILPPVVAVPTRNYPQVVGIIAT